MPHHRCRRDAIASEAPRVLVHQIDSSVAEAVLLSQVAGEAFTPAVHALRALADAQAIARLLQSVADVVVVPVSKRFVEQTNPVQRACAVDGITRADVIGVAVWKRKVALLEVDAHRADAERR